MKLFLTDNQLNERWCHRVQVTMLIEERSQFLPCYDVKTVEQPYENHNWRIRSRHVAGTCGNIFKLDDCDERGVCEKYKKITAKKQVSKYVGREGRLTRQRGQFSSFFKCCVTH